MIRRPTQPTWDPFVLAGQLQNIATRSQLLMQRIVSNQANVTKLVAVTAAVEKNCGIRGRVLWSESDESLAQKLIARLQKVQ